MPGRRCNLLTLGWRGLDPTSGDVTSANHLMTGVSTHPRGSHARVRHLYSRLRRLPGSAGDRQEDWYSTTPELDASFCDHHGVCRGECVDALQDAKR